MGSAPRLLTAAETPSLRLLPGTRKEEVFDEGRDEQHECNDTEQAYYSHTQHHASAFHHSIHIDLLCARCRSLGALWCYYSSRRAGTPRYASPQLFRLNESARSCNVFVVEVSR